MGLMNVEVTGYADGCASAVYNSRDHQRARELGAPFIHWLTPENSMPAKVVMPDTSVAEGLAEKKASALKVDSILQFERFGFVRVDQTAPWAFYYSHD
jgi:hypothetical protein